MKPSIPDSIDSMWNPCVCTPEAAEPATSRELDAVLIVAPVGHAPGSDGTYGLDSTHSHHDHSSAALSLALLGADILLLQDPGETTFHDHAPPDHGSPYEAWAACGPDIAHGAGASPEAPWNGAHNDMSGWEELLDSADAHGAAASWYDT